MFFNLRKDYKPQEEAVQPQAPLPASSNSLLEPKQIEINGCKFIISKMPCTTAQEVLINLPQGFIPILSDFSRYKQYIYKMLSYCERVYTDGRGNIALVSEALIDNHVPNFDTLYKLEFECLNYNYDFFKDGRAWTFLNQGVSLVKSNLSEILTDLLGRLFQQAEQRSGS